MKELLAANGGVIGLATLVMLASLAFLSGLSKTLEVIKDKTKTDLDNKLYASVNKIAGVIQTGVDWIAPRTSKTDAPKQ